MNSMVICLIIFAVMIILFFNRKDTNGIYQYGRYCCFVCRRMRG